MQGLRYYCCTVRHVPLVFHELRELLKTVTRLLLAVDRCVPAQPWKYVSDTLHYTDSYTACKGMQVMQDDNNEAADEDPDMEGELTSADFRKLQSLVDEQEQAVQAGDDPASTSVVCASATLVPWSLHIALHMMCKDHTTWYVCQPHWCISMCAKTCMHMTLKDYTTW